VNAPNFSTRTSIGKLGASASYPGYPRPAVTSAPRKEPRQSVSLESLAAFERSKRRKRHPAALRADVHREQARVEASGTPYRVAEGAGQLALFDADAAATPK